MKVAMFTNTFTPHVGGVARSVQGLVDELRRLGHDVLVVAPRFDHQHEDGAGVVRIPAVQNFNGTDFSIPLPAPLKMAGALKDFNPDIIHSHHPFLLGDTALRLAASSSVPVVFTHHTRYEQYTHYLPGDSAALKHFVIDLVIGYCNLCNGVVAPSESIADILRSHNVQSPVEVIPTGIDPLFFAKSDRGSPRRRLEIPEDAFIVGHVGRLAPEKNLPFLVDAVARFLLQTPKARFLLVGEGPAREEMLDSLARQGLADRLHLLGVVDRQVLADAYHCMDVFAFASHSETQGMVLAEAMAAGTPVVALDASGVREIVTDAVNGRLLYEEKVDSFAMALAWLAEVPEDQRTRLRQNAYQTAEQYSQENCVRKMLDFYNRLTGSQPSLHRIEESGWQSARKMITKEIEIIRNYGNAIEDTLRWLPLAKNLQRPED
jgi:1,2-diacylglycerol 3-alpha-glucosyltransferase